jgi:DNA (cytosine-5)-methyltransferase 1
MKYNAIGWIRDRKGNVVRYNVKDVCNCITQFSDGSGFKDPDTLMANTSPYILIEHDDGQQEIRRLTPREVYRLMGVSDPDIDLLLTTKMKSELEDNGPQLMLFGDDEWSDMITGDYEVPLISPSEHYKLAGNSIVVDVLTAIYRQLLPQGKQISIVTLCSGYDSQCLALRRISDYRLVRWAEFDPESSRPLDKQPAVVAHNLLFPEVAKLNVGDMTKADWQSVGEQDIDLLTYSTPCTDISKAGRQAGLEKGSGTRSAVLWYTEQAIQSLRPRYLLQENVASLVSKKMKPQFDEWLSTLERLGYRNEWRILNAKHYGVPQNRERVFCVSIRNDIATDFAWPERQPLNRTMADIVEQNVDRSYYLPPESVEAFRRRL